MRYVQRRDGKIVGLYAKPQLETDGSLITDAEPLANDHPEILAFLHPEPTPEQIRAKLEAALDAHVDATARGMGYRSSESCAGYAASTDATFKAEALAFIAWRDALWRTAIAVMQAVLAGQRAVPTREELLAEMPAFERPGQ